MRTYDIEEARKRLEELVEMTAVDRYSFGITIDGKEAVRVDRAEHEDAEQPEIFRS